MGDEKHHNYTALLLLIFAVLILLGAIFFTVSQSKVRGIEEYKTGNSKLNSAKNNLLLAYILGYIAFGMALLLAILYFGHMTWDISNEIPHLIVFILLFGLVIVSGIFGFIALSQINSSGVGSSGNNGAAGWIWIGQCFGLVALVLLIISGGWRAQNLSSKKPQSVQAKSQQELSFTAPDTMNYEPIPQVIQNPNYPAPIPSPFPQEVPMTTAASSYSTYSTYA